jgi:hypothetical protein
MEIAHFIHIIIAGTIFLGATLIIAFILSSPGTDVHGEVLLYPPALTAAAAEATAAAAEAAAA